MDADAPQGTPAPDPTIAPPTTDPASATPPPPPASAITSVFSGLGLGLVLGIIAGLSVSPVIQTILGSLVTVAAGFLTFQASSASVSPAAVRTNELRIGSFGFACVLGIALGLFARSHDSFGLSIQQQLARWTSAGYTPAQAQQFVLFERLGLKPQGQDVVSGDLQKSQSSNLFSNKLSATVCEQWDPHQFKSADGMLNQMALTNPQLAARATHIRATVPADPQQAAVNSAWEELCSTNPAK